MTDDRSPINAALDVFLFAPLGLALTIGEELPKLAAKGRAKLTFHVTTARVVGQFTVAQGRRQVDRRVRSQPGEAPSVSRSDAAAEVVSGQVAMSDPVGRPASPGPEVTDPGPEVPSPAGRPVPAAPGVSVASPPVAQPAPPVSQASPLSNGGVSTAPPSVSTLAIPGYDSLSASQVVQRLAGLSTAELEAVKGYEAANRGRRTVLARVGQLQAG